MSSHGGSISPAYLPGAIAPWVGPIFGWGGEARSCGDRNNKTRGSPPGGGRVCPTRWELPRLPYNSQNFGNRSPELDSGGCVVLGSLGGQLPPQGVGESGPTSRHPRESKSPNECRTNECRTIGICPVPDHPQIGANHPRIGLKCLESLGFHPHQTLFSLFLKMVRRPAFRPPIPKVLGTLHSRAGTPCPGFGGFGV